jgi:toxoflavin synthase
MAQYDTIAFDYQEIAAASPMREPEWYSLRLRLGDLTGLSVLDLACGDGQSTRLLKRWGAARVVGVDVSEQMIGLARQQEQAQPLGIEYRVADVATLGRIGEFDRVSAAYLLHYAPDREQLRQMVQTVYDNLKPGQRFVANVPNVLQPSHLIADHPKLGFNIRLADEMLHEGARLRATLFLGENTVEFDFFWLPWEAYEEAFRTVGFRAWKAEPFLIPPDSEQRRGKGFWDEYLRAPSAVHIICEK